MQRATAVAAIVVASCATPPKAEPGPDPSQQPEPTEPTDEGATAAKPPEAGRAEAARARQISEEQALRLRRLRFLESRGTIELRWKDKDGEHFEQCDLRLFAMPPSRTALRLSKLSEQYAWLGSDEEQWWVFRLKESPSTVEIRPWRETSGEGLSLVSPRSILTLAGLAPLRAAEAIVSEDATRAEITIDLAETKEAARSRWTLDAGSLLPRSIAILDETGAVVATSVLEEYSSAAVDGVPPGDYPKVARRVTVTRADGNGSIKLSLDEPSARGDRIKPQFFDLNELMRSLRPEEVIYRAAPSPPERVPGSDADRAAGSDR